MRMGGLSEDALTVLDSAEHAFEKLGNTEQISNLRTLRADIQNQP